MLWFLCAVFLSPLFGEALAAKKEINLGETTLDVPFRYPKKNQKVARFRLSIELTPYLKYLVRDINGRVKEAFRPAMPLKHNLRARIDKKNHFYMGKYHIETIPLSWEKKQKKLQLQIKFYKRYGDDKNLEELLGSTKAVGFLRGEKHLFVFETSKRAKFYNALRHPLLSVHITKPYAQKQMSKKDLSKIKPKGSL